MTGDVCGIGCDPAVPPAWTGDFCTMFWAPASIVWRTPVVVARCRIVTPARKGRGRYFKLASGRSSSWLAVRARDQAKSGIVSSLLSAHQLVSVCVTVILAPTAARAELLLLDVQVLRSPLPQSLECVHHPSSRDLDHEGGPVGPDARGVHALRLQPL